VWYLEGMHRRGSALLAVGLVSPVLVVACSDEPSSDAWASVGAEGTRGSTGDTTMGDLGDGDHNGDGDRSGDGDHNGDGDRSSTGDGDPSDGDGDPSDGDGPKFDLAPIGDASLGGGGCGQGGGGIVEFSYIYISNTTEGTLSKLNTQTMVEEARYRTRPDGFGSPSRTSVSLSGDVVVANRNGGLTKVYARIGDCEDTNGVPGIQTSSGKNNVLAWGEEECVAWYTPFPQFTSQRPVAWTAGEYEPETCTYTNQKVWSAGLGNGLVEVVRVNGDTGELEAAIPIPGLKAGWLGPYGGVVDGDSGFWFMTYVATFPLVHVYEDLSYEVHTAPDGTNPYGITIDHHGRIWVATDIGGTLRFDPQTQQWDQLPGVTGLGIQEHPDGYMWMGTYPTKGIQAIDVETMELGPFIPLPQAGNQTKGVSVDFYGYVWLVDMVSSAFRIDPDTLQYEVYDQLNMPYTYSDMTGWALSNVSPQG
jgi:hypothetical protein